MVPFLKQVAAHYYEAGRIGRLCFVFPNRRSAVFFRKYLGEVVREGGTGSPMLAPTCLTINDFFYRVYGGEVTDRIRLLLCLYDAYREVFPRAEALDEFIFWGEIILADFDDVDKYLADVRDLFTNVQEFKDIQDDYSHLTQTQWEAVKNFVQHFRDQAGRLTVRLDTEDPSVKARFLQIWNILLPLYRKYRERLRSQGMAYEGMVYRDLADRLKAGASVTDILSDSFPGEPGFVFVGLNALNACERMVLGKMRDAGIAEFCWDFASDAIRDPRNRASYFMRDNVQAFPPAFETDTEGLGEPVFHVVSVPSAVGQAKLAPEILATCEGDPVETAFVLPDEHLLMPLLNAIPPDYASINVTMGCPLTGGAIYSMVKLLSSLQLRLRQKGTEWFFYHRDLRSLFSNSLFRAALTDEEKQILDGVRAAGQYFVSTGDLQGGPLLDRVFRPVLLSPKEADAEQNKTLSRYLGEIISYVGWKIRDMEALLLELDFAKRCLMSVQLLGGMDLAVLPSTWLRLLDSLLAGESVPFSGEPLEGLQVMGPLETRALDFRNLVILSANEGSFPRRSVSASFIPPELRRGFGLPTNEYQDSVWAYYFYRMIQRASQVWLVFDSRTEGLKSGEESRYIKQLEYYFRVKLKRHVSMARMHLTPALKEIPKTPEDIARIREGVLSASTLQSYLYCPAKFYYQFVKGLKAEEELEDALDAGSLGTVFHAAMQRLYDGLNPVTGADIDHILQDRKGLKDLIRRLIMEELNTFELSGRNLVVEEVILEYVIRTLQHDRALLARSGSPGFQILGLERRLECRFEGFRLKGFADRIDRYLGDEVRIVDYKTGKVEDDDIDIMDGNAAEVVGKLFGPSNARRPKIALQLFLYGLLAQSYADLKDRPVVNSIYSVSRLFTDPLQDRVQSPEFNRLTRECLRTLLSEMTDPEVPFRLTAETDTCSYCDFKTICGR